MLRLILLLICSSGPLAFAATADLPKKPDFRREVLPILAHKCYKCHSDEKQKGDLNFQSHESLFERDEPVLIRGKSTESRMIHLLRSEDPEERMPPKGAPLTDEEVATLSAWIDSGAEWVQGGGLDIKATVAWNGRWKPGALALEAPAPAPGGESRPAAPAHPIDRILALPDAATIDDVTFARRVWLDAVGLLPPAGPLREFLADTGSEKRTRLVEGLLADSTNYAAHWMAFWQDHLRDGGSGVDEAGNPKCKEHYHVRPITEWLHRSLVENKPLDQLVQELVNPPSLPIDPYKEKKRLADLPQDSSGFLQGIRIGGAKPEAVQSSEVQAAQNLAQVFLGVQLKCATCHDSFVDGWKQKEAWALASVFSSEPLEMHKAETALGKTAPPAFLYPELNAVKPDAPQRERLEQLAKSVTSRENALFARTIVNRLWARLFGRGVIEPLDDMAQPAWNAELLDWLAADFVEHGFDLKHTIARILTSAAYQRPAAPAENAAADEYVFRGPHVRRVTAEQFLDALYAMQGRPHRAWPQQSTPLIELLGRPDRQIVATTRSHEATSLQALELMNGATLKNLLYQHEPPKLGKRFVNDRCPVTGQRLDSTNVDRAIEIVEHEGLPLGFADKKSVEAFQREPWKFVPKLAREVRAVGVVLNPPKTIAPGADLKEHALERFRFALGREPSSEESSIIDDIFGKQPSLDDLADITWLILMKPEFQLIR